jgi:3-methyladenine DNA glycosylase AlkC
LREPQKSIPRHVLKQDFEALLAQLKLWQTLSNYGVQASWSISGWCLNWPSKSALLTAEKQDFKHQKPPIP